MIGLKIKSKQEKSKLKKIYSIKINKYWNENYTLNIYNYN